MKNKKPFLSEKAFLEKQGFVAADSIGEYERLARSFDGKKTQYFRSALESIELRYRTVHGAS